ncbi:hypothetical protein AYI69_g4523, partial [Smittium culicis]
MAACNLSHPAYLKQCLNGSFGWKITANLYWLLSVTDFLRTSDIHRVDGERSRVEQELLYLVIVVPKEKRGGRPIEKPCQIKLHADIILCP